MEERRNREIDRQTCSCGVEKLWPLTPKTEPWEKTHCPLEECEDLKDGLLGVGVGLGGTGNALLAPKHAEPTRVS